MLLEGLLLEAAPKGGAGAGMMQFVFIGGMILVFYLFMIRPQQKKQKEAKAFREGIKKGDNIITIGGIVGRISSFEGEFIYLEVDKGIKIKVSKTAIDSENTRKLATANTGDKK